MRPLTYKRLGKLGGLGNQLFEVASTVGVARKLDRPIDLDPEWSYRPFFSLPDEWFDDGWTHAEDSPRYFAGPPNRWTPYGQRPENFAHVADEIRAAFAPSPRAQAVLDALPEPGADDVAVHVRRTDYLTMPDHLPVLSVGYYFQAAHTAGFMRSGGYAFHGYGDDEEWARLHLDSQLDWQATDTTDDDIAEPRDWLDLFRMARYQNLIIANSSYSFWSAVLAGPDATVVAPARWFGPAIDVPSPALDSWIQVEA